MKAPRMVATGVAPVHGPGKQRSSFSVIVVINFSDGVVVPLPVECVLLYLEDV